MKTKGFTLLSQSLYRLIFLSSPANSDRRSQLGWEHHKKIQESCRKVCPICRLWLLGRYCARVSMSTWLMQTSLSSECLLLLLHFSHLLRLLHRLYFFRLRVSQLTIPVWLSISECRTDPLLQCQLERSQFWLVYSDFLDRGSPSYWRR